MSANREEKRLKRRIIGRNHRFFVVTQPGLEILCRKEMQTLLPPSTPIRPTSGGIEFEGKLPICYLSNLSLRTATRILMRIHGFTATNFARLKKRLRDVDWELYLPANCTVRVSVSTQNSRLYHSDAISQRVIESIQSRIAARAHTGGNKNRPSNQMDVFVRAERDRFIISIDSSGELLHKRAIKDTGFPAPLRETAAAGALMHAGYSKTKFLLDPMCGSGTIAIEACMMAQRIPPGWYRDFAFMHWPAFRKTRWQEIREKARNEFKTIETAIIFASDIDDRTCRSLQNTVTKHGWENLVRVEQLDFFHRIANDCGHQNGLLMINPPYGRRLSHDDTETSFFQRLANHLTRSFGGWNVGIILPAKKLHKFFPPQLQSHALFHGGLHLTLLTGKLPG